MTDSILNYKGSRIGVLICGHGSREEKALEEFENLVKKIKARLEGIPVEFGYLEFARPIIRESLDRLIQLGVDEVIAIPAMLFAAGHAKNDIPSLLNAYASETGLKIKYGRELGINSLMIGAAGGRIKEIINLSPAYPISETLLVVVGRGSSDPDANSNVYKITRMLVEGLGLGWGETCFSGVTFPMVEPGLRMALKLGYKRIVVFPYFLFSGVLINRIRSHTEKVSRENPNVEIISAGYLSDHPLVEETFIERINDVFQGVNAMNCSLCKYRSSLLGFENEVGLVQQSHHHHAEANIDVCSVCCSGTTCDCEIEPSNSNDLKDDLEDHHHFEYPNSNHPLGPVTLRFLNGRQI